jgi:uncharacterized protein YcbK (DUF882 family)
VSPDLIPTLESVREIYGGVMIVSSGYRCPKHNAEVGGGPEHMRGMAADILLDDGGQVYRLVKAAMIAGIVRIGVNAKENEKDEPVYFVHIGIDRTLSAWLWTY